MPQAFYLFLDQIIGLLMVFKGQTEVLKVHLFPSRDYTTACEYQITKEPRKTAVPILPQRSLKGESCLTRPEILYEQSIRTDLHIPILSYIFLYKTYKHIENCIKCYEKTSNNYKTIDMFVYSVRIISPA